VTLLGAGAAPAETTPPPTLDASIHDLILLNSGESLQGDIDGIRDDEIRFDGVELEDLVIDLADVAEIITERPHTLRFEGRRDVLTGPVRMDKETFTVGSETRPRGEFMSMIPGEPTE
jgi:hypothetical protein